MIRYVRRLSWASGVASGCDFPYKGRAGTSRRIACRRPMSPSDPLLQSCDGLPDVSGVLPLARRARTGDQAALTELFTRFQEPLRRIVRIRMGARLRHTSGLESLDVVQQTFTKAWTKLDEFEPRSERAVLSWLARIAERQIHDEYDKGRAAKRGGGTTTSLEQLLGSRPGSSQGLDPAADDSLPDHRAERAELCRIVDEAVQELDDHYREVILLRTYGDADWDEVARLIDAPSIKAAQAVHFRARARLASILTRRLPQDLDGEF